MNPLDTLPVKPTSKMYGVLAVLDGGACSRLQELGSAHCLVGRNSLLTERCQTSFTLLFRVDPTLRTSD